MEVYFPCTGELVLNKQLIFQSVEVRGSPRLCCEEATSYLSLAFLQSPNCHKMQRDNFTPRQLIFPGAAGLEVCPVRALGARGTAVGRGPGGQEEARGSTPGLLRLWTSDPVSTSFQICALLENPAVQIWAEWAISVILARTHNMEFILLYGPVSAAEWQIIPNPEYNVYLC